MRKNLHVRLCRRFGYEHQDLPETLGLYVHNDVVQAFGTPEKQILIEPVFAQWIQSAHGKAFYGFDCLLSSNSSNAFTASQSVWLPGWLNGINDNSSSLFLQIGPGDFLVHHAIALGLHTTTLILVCVTTYLKIVISLFSFSCY